nr:immunoglobulin light chain junction region [Macaca mulatta]MOX17851.1 immunoglobulin light chain junction region [Macaca mulatta]MOX18221.1 immunoglobulin light chain junction region [Macaca mulatta]MOX18400.1 immunoglobulin light chain junction region [Macaca mulatta]MOX19048.1 immunoglobulin light chain junction region [Macaca mulatta]
DYYCSSWDSSGNHRIF